MDDKLALGLIDTYLGDAAVAERWLTDPASYTGDEVNRETSATYLLRRAAFVIPLIENDLLLRWDVQEQSPGAALMEDAGVLPYRRLEELRQEMREARQRQEERATARARRRQLLLFLSEYMAVSIRPAVNWSLTGETAVEGEIYRAPAGPVMLRLGKVQDSWTLLVRCAACRAVLGQQDVNGRAEVVRVLQMMADYLPHSCGAGFYLAAEEDTNNDDEAIPF